MDEIPIIETIDNDGFVPVLNPQFVVLGMLEEYGGRLALEGGSTVEGFYSTEGPLADVFAKYLGLYGRSLGIDPAAISIRHGATGSSSVESKVLNAQVNALYRCAFEDDRFITMEDGRTHRCTHVALGIEDFPRKSSIRYTPSEMNPRFSYLYGVILRFGQDGLVVKMANASRKVELIKRVLEDLDVEWIEHRYTVLTAPIDQRIAFGADERLATFLQSALVERAEAFAAAASRG